MLYIHYMHWKCLHFINLPRTQYVSAAAPASLAGHLQQEGLVAICPYPMTARTHALPPTEQPMQSVNKVPRLYRMNRWCSECDTQQRQQRLWVAKHFLVPLGRNLHPVLVGDDPATATHIFIISQLAIAMQSTQARSFSAIETAATEDIVLLHALYHQPLSNQDISFCSPSLHGELSTIFPVVLSWGLWAAAWVFKHSRAFYRMGKAVQEMVFSWELGWVWEKPPKGRVKGILYNNTSNKTQNTPTTKDLVLHPKNGHRAARSTLTSISTPSSVLG